MGNLLGEIDGVPVYDGTLYHEKALARVQSRIPVGAARCLLLERCTSTWRRTRYYVLRDGYAAAGYWAYFHHNCIGALSECHVFIEMVFDERKLVPPARCPGCGVVVRRSKKLCNKHRDWLKEQSIEPADYEHCREILKSVEVAKAEDEAWREHEYLEKRAARQREKAEARLKRRGGPATRSFVES